MLMDQPKIERILRLIVLLSGHRVYTIEELADELQTSDRTIYRYIDTFKKAGFVVDKIGDYKYHLVSLGAGVKDLKNVVYFSPEEAFVVDRLIDSLDPTHSMKGELRKKLAAIYGKTGIAEVSNRPTSARKVQVLLEAIKRKKAVRIVSYSSSYSGKTEDHLVEPFEMTSNYADVWAYDLADGKNKRFLVVRMEDVERTEVDWAHALAHHSLPMDDFRVHGDKEYHVVLRLNRLAKNLMIEEFPLTERHLVPQDGLMDLQEACYTMADLTLPAHDMDDEEVDYWIYEADVRGLDGIGRFVLGLEGNIEVMEGDALIEYLKAHAAHINETY